MKIAIYPGSFDPVTNGHVDIVARAAELADELVVAVIRNPEKRAKFSLKQREEMLRGSLRKFPNVKVESFDGLLVDFARKKHANIIVRGLRAVSDFDYEFQMALTNRQMAPEIETLFFMTDHNYSYLSSSFVKQIAHFGGDISDLVPPAVARRLKGNKMRTTH